MTTKEKLLKYKLYNQKRKGYRKSYYNKHPLKRLSWSMNYLYKNGTITGYDLWKIAKKQRMICPLSGEKLTNENISVDHIISKSNGGINNVVNIRLVTKFVNISKQTMTDEMFVSKCKQIVDHMS